jgi:predicted  nucleic acid-binding Zn-ribbon protein
MTEKELYQANVEAQLRDWLAEIGKLKDKFSQAGIKGQNDDRPLQALTRNLEEIERKLAQVVQADEKQWEALKAELDEALVSWRHNYEQAQMEILKTDE